jgi:hypothetical protein
MIIMTVYTETMEGYEAHEGRGGPQNMTDPKTRPALVLT